MKKLLILMVLGGLVGPRLFAGNPDRRGEAGAYELLMNGWGRSTGQWGMNSASVTGLESERINVAGLSFTQSMEVSAAYSLWMQGSGIGVAHAGIAQRIRGENVIGLSIQSLQLGEFIRTTVNDPEGNQGSFSPSFLNIGISYARAFTNAIRGGVTFRLVNEGLPNANATGFVIDAGLQYVTGKKENIHFGIALRNVGAPLRFRGDGLQFTGLAPSGQYNLAVSQNSNKFEMPTQLNIGASYDFLFGQRLEFKPGSFRNDYRITLSANFTSNAFGNDNYGVGLEFSYKDIVMLRSGYRFEEKIFNPAERTTVYTGLAAGATFNAPFKKDGTGPNLAIDYSFRATNPFQGTHSIGILFGLGETKKGIDKPKQKSSDKPAKEKRSKRKKGAE